MALRGLSVSFLLCAMWPGAALSQEGRTVPSESAVRKAISRFLDDPRGYQGRAAAGTILQFASNSDSVTVEISFELTPWMTEDKRHGEILLAAYIAGNVRSQLDSGVNGNDSYSGLILVFRAYRFLKKRERTYRVAAVEELLELHRAGELMEHLVEVGKKDEE